MDSAANRIECGLTEATPAPPSGTLEAPRGLTEVLWGIRWEDFLPHQVTADVLVVASCYDQALPFIEDNYGCIFEDDGDQRFYRTKSVAQRAHYYRKVGDFFEFKQGARSVGLLIGTAIDWSTYYIRSAAALPEVQGKGMIQRFFHTMFPILKRAGVERVEAETAPTNMAVIHLLSRMRFNPSGTILSDRWGALLKLTRYLDEDAEQVFLDRFCLGVRYQEKDHPGSKRASAKGE